MEDDTEISPPKTVTELLYFFVSRVYHILKQVYHVLKPKLKRMIIVVSKTVLSLTAAFILAVSVPAFSEAIDEVVTNPVQVVATGEDGKQVVEEAGTGAKIVQGIGNFFGATARKSGEIKDGFFNVTVREKNLKLELKAALAMALQLRKQLATYKVEVGANHGYAKQCAKDIANYLDSMEGN